MRAISGWLRGGVWPGRGGLLRRNGLSQLSSSGSSVALFAAAAAPAVVVIGRGRQGAAHEFDEVLALDHEGQVRPLLEEGRPEAPIEHFHGTSHVPCAHCVGDARAHRHRVQLHASTRTPRPPIQSGWSLDELLSEKRIRDGERAGSTCWTRSQINSGKEWERFARSLI